MWSLYETLGGIGLNPIGFINVEVSSGGFHQSSLLIGALDDGSGGSPMSHVDFKNDFVPCHCV